MQLEYILQIIIVVLLCILLYRFTVQDSQVRTNEVIVENPYNSWWGWPGYGSYYGRYGPHHGPHYGPHHGPHH